MGFSATVARPFLQASCLNISFLFHFSLSFLAMGYYPSILSRQNLGQRWNGRRRDRQIELKLVVVVVLQARRRRRAPGADAEIAESAKKRKWEREKKREKKKKEKKKREFCEIERKRVLFGNKEEGKKIWVMRNR
jgi:hypothetical protein